MLISCFSPIGDCNAHTLILGSMPSVVSLQKGEYYGHPSNDFWPIISTIFDCPITTYQEKLESISINNIAIWDVFANCVRINSKDSTIDKETVNDFSSFFHTHPHIGKIIANGKKAYTYLLNLDSIPQNIPIHYGVSTSRAYPLSFNKKLSLWKELLT